MVQDSDIGPKNSTLEIYDFWGFLKLTILQYTQRYLDIALWIYLLAISVFRELQKYSSVSPVLLAIFLLVSLAVFAFGKFRIFKKI